MFQSIICKEWIKTHWFMVTFLSLGLLSVGLIFLRIQHDIRFYGSCHYWNVILFQGKIYFDAFKFIPSIGGLVLGVSQYFPETVDKRLKLSFHLPLNENKMLLLMMTYGTLMLSIIFFVLLVQFVALSTVFFPYEIIHDAVVSIIPWILSGYSAYFLIALIILEPVWRYRFMYTIVGGFYLSFCFKEAVIGAYSTMNISLTIFSVALSISLLFSGYRFRKGKQ